MAIEHFEASYVVCQATPLSHSEAKERRKLEKSLNMCSRVAVGRGNEKPGMCVDKNGILSELCSHSMKLNNEEFTRGTPPMAF